MLPAVENLVTGAGYVSRGEFSRGAGELAEGIGLFFGGPVSGTKEMMRGLGVGDDDGEFEFNPEAFLGRRK
jgi:hypothetical protein